MRTASPGAEIHIVDNHILMDKVTVTAQWDQLPKATVKTPPAGKTLDYTGSEQELVSAGEARGGTMVYVIGTDGTTAPVSGWSESIPKGKEPGTYYIWYKAAGDASHSDSKKGCTTATIAGPPVVPVYSYTEGADAEWTKGNKTGLNFEIKGSPDDKETFEKFIGLASDGSTVAAENYTAASGSVKLTIKAAWLETLTAGKHTLTANFKDGKAEASFTVKDAPPPADGPADANADAHTNTDTYSDADAHDDTYAHAHIYTGTDRGTDTGTDGNSDRCAYYRTDADSYAGTDGDSDRETDRKADSDAQAGAEDRGQRAGGPVDRADPGWPDRFWRSIRPESKETEMIMTGLRFRFWTCSQSEQVFFQSIVNDINYFTKRTNREKPIFRLVG